MESRQQIIERIIHIPLTFKAGENKSMVQCLKETGYEELGGKIDVSEILSALHDKPNVIDGWFIDSYDKRCDGWYVMECESSFEVGYNSRGVFRDVKKFDDEIRACAEYIYHEFFVLAKFAEMPEKRVAVVRKKNNATRQSIIWSALSSKDKEERDKNPKDFYYKQAMARASVAWAKKDYSTFLKLATPYEDVLTKSEAAKLCYARKHKCEKGGDEGGYDEVNYARNKQ